MRTSLRATISIVVALGVLLAVAVAAATADGSPPAVAQEDPGGGASGGAAGACLEGAEDCDDMIVSPVPTDPSEPRVVSPRPGMVNVTARPFDSATLGDDGRTVTIDFWSGVEPCYVLDHVDVAYGGAVIITLFEGSEPMDEPVACIEIAELKRVIITLDEPLGDRPIIDGAAPEEPTA